MPTDPHQHPSASGEELSRRLEEARQRFLALWVESEQMVAKARAGRRQALEGE